MNLRRAAAAKPFRTTAVALLVLLVGAQPVSAGWDRGWSAPPSQPSQTVAADGRTVWLTHQLPFAETPRLRVLHPAAVVEHVGLHQSNHEGARDQLPLDSAVPWTEMPSRGRLSGPRSAADVVVPPDEPILSPVTGTVIRAGGYRLYCVHDDSFVVISPDAAPDWEVKLLHISGLHVEVGSRVLAGSTQLADHATSFPFRSQVDDMTAEPSWPHTHVEVIDPSIENVGNPGSGGC